MELSYNKNSLSTLFINENIHILRGYLCIATFLRAGEFIISRQLYILGQNNINLPL
jgi:hypothetical protein